MTVSPVTYYRIRWRKWYRAYNSAVYRLIVALELEEPLERVVEQLNRRLTRR